MGNSLASLMLFVWPLVVIVLFRTLSVPKALVISFAAGYLILPTQPVYGLPLLPPYGKTLAIVLPSLAMAWLATRPARSRLVSPVSCRPGWLPDSMLLRVCLVAIVLGTAMTVLTNGDPLQYPTRTIRALQPREAVSLTVAAVAALLPFIMARKFLARPEDQTLLLTVLAIAALLYSLPALWEVRMSPRLNAQIYGFFPHDWRQHLRAGGYRPVVFLEHGLRLGMFLAIGLLAASAVWRFADRDRRGLYFIGFVWLLGTLVLSKNLSAFLIVMVFLPVQLLARPRTQLLVAAVFAGMVLVYPMMRAAGLVPIQTITGTISTFAESGRLASLGFRFANEDILLEKANERPLFGWGGSARARVFDWNGSDISTVDGTWIIEFGENGWVGYLGRFGLLTAPLLLLAVRRQETISPGTSGLAVLVAANLLDLIPNSGLTPITWLMAGALAGRLEHQEQPTAEPAQDGRRVPGYRRTFATTAPRREVATERLSPERHKPRPASARTPRRRTTRERST